MNLLFVHSGAKIKEDNKGNLYIDGAYSKEVFQRYLNISDNLTVVFRKDRKIYDENYAKKNFEQFDSKKIKYVEYLDKNTSIRNFFNPHIIYKNKNKIKNLEKKNDKIIVRVPCSAGYEAAKYARKYKKEYLAEVVGCIWDALWNYGLKGKILAPIDYMRMRKTVKKANYAIYVTDEFLQKRYPNENINIGCSDVVIPKVDEKILSIKKEKIDKMNAKELSMATVAAIDVKYKGQEYVLKAIRKLKDNGYNIKYYIIGGGNKEYLSNIAEKLDISENVEFTGAITHNEVFKYLDNIDIYVQPSLLEGLCRSVVEAMSRACPIIVSNVGGNTELIKNKKCVFKSKNANHLVELIESMTHEDMKKMAEENMHNSKKYIKENLEKKREDILLRFSK